SAGASTSPPTSRLHFATLRSRRSRMPRLRVATSGARWRATAERRDETSPAETRTFHPRDGAWSPEPRPRCRGPTPRHYAALRGGRRSPRHRVRDLRRDGHEREGRVPAGRRDEDAAVARVEVVDLVELAVRVDDGGRGVASHAERPHHVTRRRRAAEIEVA